MAYSVQPVQRGTLAVSGFKTSWSSGWGRYVSLILSSSFVAALNDAINLGVQTKVDFDSLEAVAWSNGDIKCARLGRCPIKVQAFSGVDHLQVLNLRFAKVRDNMLGGGDLSIHNPVSIHLRIWQEYPHLLR